MFKSIVRFFNRVFDAFFGPPMVPKADLDVALQHLNEMTDRCKFLADKYDQATRSSWELAQLFNDRILTQLIDELRKDPEVNANRIQGLLKLQAGFKRQNVYIQQETERQDKLKSANV